MLVLELGSGLADHGSLPLLPSQIQTRPGILIPWKHRISRAGRNQGWWSPIPDPAELYPKDGSSKSLSRVPFMAESCLNESCSDKMEKELQSRAPARLKGGRSFSEKEKRKLGNKVTSTASGNPRDDKSFRVAQQQRQKPSLEGRKGEGVQSRQEIQCGKATRFAGKDTLLSGSEDHGIAGVWWDLQRAPSTSLRCRIKWVMVPRSLEQDSSGPSLLQTWH